MFKILKRISRFLALILVYVACAYNYMSVKGFVFKDGTPILTNTAKAKEESFAKKVTNNFTIIPSLMRVKGNADAPLTMYAFSSMACGHCSEFHNYTLPKIEQDFIANGKVKYIFVHVPLDVVSMRAAKLSYCLPPEKYDEFISNLYHRKDWLLSGKEETLNKYATDLGLSEAELKACNDNKRLTSEILLTRSNALGELDIASTPSFLIEGKDGKELIVGAHSYRAFKEYLNARLTGE